MNSDNNVQFQLPNGNNIIVTRCNIRSYDDILRAFQNKNIYFSEKCIQCNLHFKMANKEILPIDFPLKNIPKSAIIKVELNGDFITMKYDTYEFTFSENESVFEAIHLIALPFPRSISTINIMIKEEGTNKILAANYRLKKNDKCIIFILCKFVFISVHNENIRTLLKMDLNSKVSDAQNILQCFFSNNPFDLPNFIFYYKNGGPVTDTSKLLVDIIDSHNAIFFDVEFPTSKKKINFNKKTHQKRFYIKKDPKLIKVDFEFVKEKEKGFSHEYDINTTIKDIQEEMIEKYKIGGDKKVAISYKYGQNKIEIDRDMTLEDVIDDIKEEDPPRNVLFIEIKERAKVKRIHGKKPLNDTDKPKSSKTADLNIRTYYYQTNQNDVIRNIEVDSGCTVKEMKTRISLQEKVDDINNIAIIFNGKKLSNEMILDDLDIKDITLYVYIKSSEDILLMTAKALKIEKEVKFKFLDKEMIDKLLQKKQIIGSGATSTVYKVKNIITGEGLLAVKMLNKSFFKIDSNKTDDKNVWKDDDDDFDDSDDFDDDIPFDKIQEIFKEWEILSNLDHPNIIKTFGFYNGDETNPPMIVLEYCKFNLSNSIQHLENIDLVKIVYELCSAMNYLHKKNIIHRDLKITNILINTQKQCKVCDFGISKLVDAKTLTSMTHGVGTFIYMAPELFDETCEYDEKVDVYAFGVVLYFIVTKGQKPKVKQNISLENCDIPNNTTNLSRSLIKKCLSYSPKDRPSFEEIIKMIDDNHFNLFDGINQTISSLGFTS